MVDGKCWWKLSFLDQKLFLVRLWILPLKIHSEDSVFNCWRKTTSGYFSKNGLKTKKNTRTLKKNFGQTTWMSVLQPQIYFEPQCFEYQKNCKKTNVSKKLFVLYNSGELEIQLKTNEMHTKFISPTLLIINGGHQHQDF